LEREFHFHPTRRWRADFAHLPSRTLIEIEGGIYVNGRHNRAGGFAADLENRAEIASHRLPAGRRGQASASTSKPHWLAGGWSASGRMN
jgi:hypothetical protein